MLKVNLIDGVDLSDIIGVLKYSPPEDNSGNSNRVKSKGYFPSFLSKTDECRLQSAKGLLEAVRNVPLYAAYKIDGSSCSIFLKDEVFGVCSRNLETARCEGSKFWEVVDKYNIEEAMRNMGDNISIQGELVGPGIQNNRLKLKEVDFYVFNFYDIAKGEYLDYEDFILNVKALGLKTVPIHQENFVIGDKTLDDMVAISDGLKINLGGGEVLAEGLVWRPMKEIRDYRGNRVSFKIINNSYLLKHSI